jgi:tetratricopeptide (TPR) repeat protein
MEFLRVQARSTVLFTALVLAVFACGSAARAGVDSNSGPASGKAKALLDRGIAAYDKSDFKTARTAFEAALAANPRYVVAYAWLGDTLDNLGDPDAAIAEYDKALAIDPEYQYGYATRCDSRREIGGYAAALADCTKAIALNPSDAYAVRMLAKLKAATKDYTGAVKYFSQSIALDDTAPSSFTGRCSAYNNLSKYELAVDDCSKALTLDPSSDTALFYRAVAYYHVQRYDDSINDWTRYLKVDPKDDNAHYNLGRSLFGRAESEKGDAASADLRTALDDFTYYIGLNKSDGDGYLWRGKVEIALHQTADANTDLKNAVHFYYVSGDIDSASKAQKLLDQSSASPGA